MSLDSYQVKDFDTTTQALEFMAEVSTFEPIMQKMQRGSVNMGDVFKVISPLKIKEIIEKNTLKNGEPYDYETEFKNNFELVFQLFGKTVEHLVSSATESKGGNDKVPLSSTKRNVTL